MLFDIEMLSSFFLLACAIGAIGGFLSGLFGIGGGLIYVPALFFAFTGLGLGADAAMHIAVGTSLAIAVPTVLTSAYSHYRRHSVDMAVFRRWAVFSVSGAALGVLTNSMMQAEQLILVFAMVAVIMALYMGFMKDPHQPHHPVRGRKRHYPVAAAIGCMASMVGISGSLIAVPVMTYLNLSMQKAIGTAAALGVLISVFGMIGFMLVEAGAARENTPPLTIGSVNFLYALMVMPISVLVAPFGCRLAHYLPQYKLRRIFAVLIACVALRMLLEA